MSYPGMTPSVDQSSRIVLEWSGNWAAVVGCIICIALLVLWCQRNRIELHSGKRDWDDG